MSHTHKPQSTQRLSVMSSKILTCISLVSLNAVFHKSSLYQICFWIWGNKINTSNSFFHGIVEPKLQNICDRHNSEPLNLLKFHLLPENKIYLLKYAILQHQVRTANVIVSNKQVIALLTLSLKVHMHRATHYY